MQKKFPPSYAGREFGVSQIVAFRGERGSYNKNSSRKRALRDCSLPG